MLKGGGRGPQKGNNMGKWEIKGKGAHEIKMVFVLKNKVGREGVTHYFNITNNFLISSDISLLIPIISGNCHTFI